MKKVLEFLERHVQWVAVGIGVLYLAWIAWTFLIGNPVKVQVNNEALGPSEVDKYIVDHPVAELSTQMQNTGVPKFTVPQWRDQFVAAIEMKDVNPVALAGLWVSSFPVPQIVTDKGVTPIPNEPGGGIAAKIEKQPAPPAAELGDVTAGASNVNKQPAAVAGGPPPPPDNNNNAQPVANTGVDLNWSSVGFRVSNKALSEAYAAAKLPKLLAQTGTCFMTVHLQRQEMKPDGTWGEPVDVKTPPTVVLVPMPADSVQMQEKQQYVQWAAAHQPDILQPAFWPVVVGDKWAPPSPDGNLKPAEVAQPQGLPDFDPNRWDYGPDEIKRMTPQQRAQWAKAKEAHDKEERQKKAGERGGRSGGGKGGKGGGGAVGGGGARGPGDGGRPPGPGYPPPPYGRPPIPNENGEMEAPPVQQTVYPCPQGLFDPTTVAQQPVAPGQPAPQGTVPEFWMGWAHDDSVEPGHTYRFRVIYTIKNPLFGFGNFCNPPTLADALALKSPPSAWSKEVRVPLRTSFYVATNPSSNGTVRFEVFTWQGGVKRGKVFDLQPGDIIGGTDGGVNYNTGWTVVDVRHDPVKDRPVVIIADPKGQIARRDYFSDQNNQDYKNDKAAAANANAAANAGANAGQ